MRVATSSSSWRNLVAPGEIVTSSDLNERFAHGQEPEGLIRYSAHNNLAMAIANNHGVARAFEVASSPDGGWYAQKAPDSEVADSIAGHNLSIAADFEVSLERLWGKTGTREGAMRSPEVRLRIFEVLSGLKPKQPIDLEILAQRAGLKAGRCQQHIQMLHQFGLVEYEASNLHNQAVFEITGDPNPESRPGIKRYGRVMPRPLDYGGDPKLRTQVGYILLGFQEEGRENFTYSDVIPKLEHPDKINMGHIAGIMGDLLREGILKRLHKSPFSNDAFSNIGVDDTQRALCNV